MKWPVIPCKGKGAYWATKNDAGSYIDLTYTEVKDKPLCSPINASNILGAVSFLIMVIAMPAAVESGMYITALVLTVIMAVCAYLSMKEDGQIK